MSKKLALVRTNYSQNYGFYDNGTTYEDRDILIPFQLLIIAAAAKNAGITVKIFDGEIGFKKGEQLAFEIADWEPDFIGITATTPDMPQVSMLCRLLRERLLKHADIIIGGCHATVMPEDTFVKTGANYVVKGYGDKAIVEIINGNYAEGVIEIPPDRFQDSPAYSLLDYENYKFTDPLCGQVKAASVMSAYGCPFKCKFCAHDKNIRYKDIDLFLGEINYLYESKGVRYFYVYDDTFLLNKERAFKILSEIERFSEAHFQCLTRANLIDAETVDRLKRANFIRVSMGLESGCDEILRLVSKGVSIADAISACQLLNIAGIETRASFILGLPYENHETINETIEFAKSLELYHANFNIMTPYPGTETYDMAIKGEGLRFKERYGDKDWGGYRRWGKSIIETDDLTADDLESYQIKAQMEFYSQEKVFWYYANLFNKGNKSRYFYRPLNFSWRRRFSKDIPFWNDLDTTKIVGEDNELN